MDQPWTVSNRCQTSPTCSLDVVLAATALDGETRRWSVMGQMSLKQADLRRRKADAIEEINRRARTHVMEMMTAASMAASAQREIDARWAGGPNVLALLFCQPDSAAFRSLDLRGQYFDHRTNSTWDLFFPGYYKSDESECFEDQCGALPVGNEFASDWFFHPGEFNRFREQVEERSKGLFQYSGEADLVLVNAYLPDQGIVTVDWESTACASLVDPHDGAARVTLSQAIERISRDIENALGEADYGLGAGVDAAQPQGGGLGRELFVGVVAEIAAALAVR